MVSNTNNDPIVSVIIPVYNGADTIEQTIKSVQNQTFSNLEILVIDNGSNDRTCSLVEEICQNDKRVRLLKSEKGRSIARNKGLTSAKGKYIKFLDADDELTNHNIERSVFFLENNIDYYAYVEGAEFINQENRVMSDTEISSVLDFRRKNPFTISAVLFRSNKNTHFFITGLDHNEDWIFWYQNLNNKKISIASHEIGQRILITGNNTMLDLDNMLGSEIIVMSIMNYKFGSLKKFKMMLMFFQSKYIYQEKFVRIVEEKFRLEYILANLAFSTPLINKLIKKLLNRKVDMMRKRSLYGD